jgi:hypothetical protein
MIVCRKNIYIAILWALVIGSLVLVSCAAPPADTSRYIVVPLSTPEEADVFQVDVQVIADNWAAETAAVARRNAQATLDSANATLSAAQIQQQNSAAVLAAQVAAAAQIAQANAQATLVAAHSTQIAAQTQDAYQQTQRQEQQDRDQMVASTQTAIANLIATKTEAAIATEQGYADQLRQNEAAIQAPMNFLLTWCLPGFLLLLAVLGIWGIWRWLKIRQDNQIILESPVEMLPPPKPDVIDYQQDNSPRYLENSDIGRRYRLTKPVDQARRWLDEVRRKLLRSDVNDEDDDPGN